MAVRSLCPKPPPCVVPAFSRYRRVIVRRAGRSRRLLIHLFGLALLVATVATTPALALQPGGNAMPAGGWLVDRVRFESLAPDGFLGVGDLGDYRGAIELVRTGSRLGVVNDVGLEDYVRGIAEVPSSWPVEALRAQAIAARTYALHEMRNPPASAAEMGAHICPTQSCQVYVGLEKERSEGGERWVSAVESTRGQVLLRKGAPIRAMYSSGALVAPAERPSGPRPAGPAPRAAAPPGPAPPPPPPSGPQPVVPPVVGPAPAPPPPPASGPPPPAAPQPGPRPAPSKRVPEGPVFRGHGMGMSQYGALAKAQRGQSASAILASYYGGLRPSRLPADRVPSSIRVAIDSGRSSVGITAPGRFRVLDGAGNPLAVVATGNWRVLPGPHGKLRVVPPPGQEAAPGLEALGHEAVPQPVIRFRLSQAALVYLSVQDGAGQVAATPPRLVEAGESALAVPPLPQPMATSVSLVADAGLNRVSRALVEVPHGGGPSSHGPQMSVVDGRPASSSQPIVLASTAFVLMLVVTSCLIVTRLARLSG